MRTAIFVVLLSTLPAMVIIAGSVYSRYQSGLAATDVRGERLVRTVALRQEQVTEVMETLVLALGRLPEVRGADAEAAGVLFRNLTAASDEYANIILMDGDGTVLASALPDGGSLNLAEYDFFRDVYKNKGLSVGRTVHSPLTGDPVLYFAAPVTLDGRNEPGAVCVALNLIRYEETLPGLVLPEGASVYLVDRTGRLASAFPKPGPVRPGEALGAGYWPTVRDSVANFGRIVAREGANAPEVGVIFKKLFLKGASEPFFYILYVQSEEAAYAHTREILRRDVAMFAGVFLLSFAAALLLCVVTVRRPWTRLLTAATNVGNGDLEARVPEKGLHGEIGMLSREFNTMAASLEKRDRELAAARDHAELSRTAKGEFLANMSHEIRTSMNAILGMAYLVLKTELTSQQRGYVSKLLAAANALLRVINDILDFSKMEAGKMTIESISFALRRILGTVRSESASRLGERKLGFELVFGQDVPDHLVGDPLRLSQALMVLVDDAVSRSERGVISLGCAVTEQSEERITLQFIVRDAGVGLTPTQLAEMRELFDLDEEEVPATLDKARLRLAIANRLFRLMQGRVEVASVFGEGVVFTATASFGYAVKALCQPEKLFEGKRALVVDGSAVSRQDLVEVLSLFGFTVECVDSIEPALEALLRAQEEGNSFAVVFMDWRPTVTDMVAQVTRLRNAHLTSPPPLVLTTASGRADMPVSLDELEIDALLPKPINESLVFDSLMNILGTHDVSTPPSSPENAGTSSSLEGLTVLLAEDNAVNQQIAGEIMEIEGIRLTFADNGEEALRLLSDNVPGTFDLVLMDLQMPVMNGFVATRAIRENPLFHPLRLPIVAMTAHSDVKEISACLEAGMNDHTGKPIIIDKFLATIRRWLPVCANATASIEAAVPLLRGLRGKTDPVSTGVLDSLLDKLVPVLHEGRVSVIKEALLEGDDQVFGRMMEALAALAEDAGKMLPSGERGL